MPTNGWCSAFRTRETGPVAVSQTLWLVSSSGIDAKHLMEPMYLAPPLPQVSGSFSRKRSVDSELERRTRLAYLAGSPACQNIHGNDRGNGFSRSFGGDGGGGRISWLNIGDFATAVKAKQGATTFLDRATMQNILSRIFIASWMFSYVVCYLIQCIQVDLTWKVNPTGTSVVIQ